MPCPDCTQTERRLRDMINLGREMRNAQTLYFKYRQPKTLDQSKALEKRFDDMLDGKGTKQEQGSLM